MPHLISDRPRLLALRASEKDPSVHDRWENTQALIYIIGGISFIVGSLLFVLGSSINILQVPAKSKRGNLQMINLTAVTFVVGSILFTVASVPYL